MTSVGKLNGQNDLFAKRTFEFSPAKFEQMPVGANQSAAAAANSIGPLSMSMWPNSAYDLDAANAYSPYNPFYSAASQHHHSHVQHSSAGQSGAKAKSFWTDNQQATADQSNGNQSADPFGASNGASFWPAYSSYGYGGSSNLNSLNSNPVSNSVFNSATSNLSSISSSFVGSLPNSLAGNLGGNLSNNLSSNLTNNPSNLGNNLSGNLANNLSSNLNSNLGSSLSSNLSNNLSSNLSSNLASNLTNNLGSALVPIKDELDSSTGGLFESGGLNNGTSAYSLRSTPSSGYIDAASQNFHHFNFPHQHPNSANSLSSTGK